MRFYNKKQNIIIIFVLIFEFFFTSTLSVSAFSMPGVGGALPDPMELLKPILDGLHMNQEALQNQGETMNVAGNKGYAPEVSLSFSPSDPKEGEKLSAKAFPMYFSNEEKSLYYTWYLKRKGCDLAKNVADVTILDRCNASDPNQGKSGKKTKDDIDVEDWKISAMRILVQNGYDPEPKPNYTNPPDDNDGYKASFGGDNKSGISKSKNYCYVHDNDSGTNYELGKAVGGEPTPRCEHLFPNAPGHKTAQNEGGGKYSFGPDEEKFWVTNPEDPSTADNGNKDEANVAGLGQSSFTWSYVALDQVGVAVEGTSMFPTKYDNSSSMIMWAFPNKKCKPTDTVDASSTDPPLPKISIRGYDVLIPTSDMHLDDCIPDNLVDPTKGGQATNLSVSVSATPDNPVNDPGSGTGATAIHDKSGDTIFVQANVDNAAQNSANILFDWKVSISDTITGFTLPGKSTVITDDLRGLGLLGSTKGNALDSINLKLDIKNTDKLSSGPDKYLPDYLDNNHSGYLKFQVNVKENFSGTTQRKGTSDVIVRFTSSTEGITAYNVEAVPPSVAGDTTKVSLPTPPDSGKICYNKDNNAAGLLEKNVCRVIKNEIIGLSVNPKDLSNFNWTINGSPLVCTARVSNDCSLYGEKKAAINADSTLSSAQKISKIAALPEGDKKIDATAQGAINYFPVTENPGGTYTITMTANDVTSGKTITLSRTFNVVEPKVVINSLSADAWQKALGKYKDIVGSKKNATEYTCTSVDADGVRWCDDLSESIYQTYPGKDLQFQATFIPGFLGNPLTTKKEWSVDGTLTTEIPTPSGYLPLGRMISFKADKPAPGIYSISLLAQVVRSDGIRKALLDIWGISPFDSPEINFASSIQVEVQEDQSTTAMGPFVGPRKYYAAIASYIPASVLFTFRIFLSVALTLFALSFLNALLEERRVATFVRNLSRYREK